MASLDQLPADQRAVLQLLLKQERTYEGLSSVLRVDPEGVRERAHAALGALGPQTAALSPERQEELSDYLLGQQPASEQARTRDFLAGSAAGRGWARVVADGLRPLSGDRLPEIPDEGEREDGERPDDAIAAAATAQPTREEQRTQSTERGREPGDERDEAERSSRLGGILLLAGLGIALAVVVVLLITGGDGGGDQQGQTMPQQQAEIIAQPNLFPPEGSDSEALGAAQLIRQPNQLALRLVAQGLEPINQRRVYAIWLTNGEAQGARRLGYPSQQPTEDQPLLAAQTGLPPEALQFGQIIVTSESAEGTAQEPGDIVLQAPLMGDPQGQQPQRDGGQQPGG